MNTKVKELKFSIIVPVYNVANYIENCLNSLLDNDRYDYEVILINDGSTDASSEICRDYAKHDQRIVLLEQNNQGLSAARNNGLDAAKGDYIIFVDSDDWVDKAYLDIIDSNIKDGCDVCVFGYTNINDTNGNRIDFRLTSGYFAGQNVGGAIIELDKKGYLLHLAWNKVYRASLLKNYRFETGVSYVEDIIFNCSVFTNLKSVLLSSDYYYYYRSSFNSLTNNRYYDNYLEISDMAVNARKALYSYYGLSLLHSGLLHSKELEYRLGYLSNIYRKKSNETFRVRNSTIHKIKEMIKAFDDAVEYMNKTQKIQYRILSFCTPVIANILFTFMYLCDGYKKNVQKIMVSFKS